MEIKSARLKVEKYGEFDFVTSFKDDKSKNYQQHYEISDENWIRIIDVAIDVGKKVADACKRKSKQILIKEFEVEEE